MSFRVHSVRLQDATFLIYIYIYARSNNSFAINSEGDNVLHWTGAQVEFSGVVVLDSTGYQLLFSHSKQLQWTYSAERRKNISYHIFPDMSAVRKLPYLISRHLLLLVIESRNIIKGIGTRVSHKASYVYEKNYGVALEASLVLRKLE
jgi:hypothetical protein